MNNLTVISNLASSKSLKPLSLNELNTIFGGNDDVVNPDDLLGDGNIIEDLTEL